ncbi:MAG: hypothetical protein LEGION0398_MBIBDBAK_00095 [Legionellaceae bacterium]
MYIDDFNSEGTLLGKLSLFASKDAQKTQFFANNYNGMQKTNSNQNPLSENILSNVLGLSDRIAPK